MIDVFGIAISLWDLGLLFVSAFFIGMAKTGVHGVGMLSVPVMAIIFGAKSSAGIVLPMLIMADIFAVIYYHRHANWGYLYKLFPAAAAGVVIATLIGDNISDAVFTQIMVLIIFASLGIMIWQETRKNKFVPDYTWFAILMGTLGGITTMIGNLAGPVMAVYLLSMRLPKNEYIGTAAWFFLVINVFKVPFHIFVWDTITLSSFGLNAITLPAIALGAFIGIWIIKRFSDKRYRWLVILMTLIAAGAMLA
ncbi:sulfite exporter TauE/SafE family protein [Glaciecola sp. 1036]|uniref:sulfite exporter TauE/SafE family protein n=1 Tax=Alteromonadaceae TaxID=72275 RepID=UPI003D058690